MLSGHLTSSPYVTALTVCAAMLVAEARAADPLHRYTFNDGTANDSIGTAHGSVFDPAGIVTYNAGRIDLSANNGAAANTDPITNGAYVDLPDGIFTSSVAAGVNGAISIEAWVNVQENRQNARIWSFGDSVEGGGFPFWGETTDWVDLNAQNSSGNLALTTHELGQGFNVNELQLAGVLPPGSRQHLVATLDQNDTMGGANPDGTMRLYLNNSEVGTQAISEFLPLGLINDVNNYLGRSQWPDPFFDGQIDEVVIYDDVLTPEEVSARFTAGPEPTPIPTFVIDRDTGEIRVENQTPVNFNLVDYSITSAAGALDVAGWVSIAEDGDSDSGGGFDDSGVWTETAATSNELAEETQGAGGPLAATTGNWSLGPAWLRSPTEDLQVMFELGDGSTGTADVSFVGNGGMPFGRSDLNTDGTVDVDDWSIFLANSDTVFADVTSVEAYLRGDLDGDLDNDFRDFRLFQDDFIAAQGEEAFAALLSGQVPEPGTLAILATALAGLAVRRRRPQATVCLLCMLATAMTFTGRASAATPALYVASDDPALVPDANAGAVDAWTTTLSADGGRGSFLGFGELGIGDSWALFSFPSAGVNGSVDADHTFAGGPLSVGQSIRLDFANSAIAAGGTVGVSLMSAGTPVATFKYNGDDPEGVYRFDDSTDVDQVTGEPFAYRTPAKLEIGLTSGGQYTAAYGLSSWTGPYSGSIDSVRVFNHLGGDGSDVIFNNLEIGPTTLVPLSLEVDKSSGDITIKGNASLAAKIDYYQITSAEGALDSAGWNSLDQQNVFAEDVDGSGTAGDSPGEGWDVSDNASDSRLTEYFLREGGATLAAGNDLPLGGAYDTSVFGPDDGDLHFVYGVAGGAQLTGAVTYVGGDGDLVGDYNDDGVVNAVDYTVWRDRLGTMFALPNRDPGNSGAVNEDDYTAWVDNFGSSQGAAGAISRSLSIPEPTAAWLLAVGLFAMPRKRPAQRPR